MAPNVRRQSPSQDIKGGWFFSSCLRVAHRRRVPKLASTYMHCTGWWMVEWDGI